MAKIKITDGKKEKGGGDRFIPQGAGPSLWALLKYFLAAVPICFYMLLSNTHHKQFTPELFRNCILGSVIGYGLSLWLLDVFWIYGNLFAKRFDTDVVAYERELKQLRKALAVTTHEQTLLLEREHADRVAEFNAQIKALEAQIAEQRTRHERALSDQVQVAAKELELLKSEHAGAFGEVRSQVQILRTNCETLQIAKASSDQEHAEVVDGLNAQLVALNGRLENVNAECTRLQQELTESLTKQQAELQRRDELAQEQISRGNAEHVGRLTELREEISSLQGSLQVAEDAERRVTTSAGIEIERLRAEIADLQGQLDRLRKEHLVVLSEKDQSHQQVVAEHTQSHAQQVVLLERRIVALQGEMKKTEAASEVRDTQASKKSLVQPLRAAPSVDSCSKCEAHKGRIRELQMECQYEHDRIQALLNDLRQIEKDLRGIGAQSGTAALLNILDIVRQALLTSITYLSK